MIQLEWHPTNQHYFCSGSYDETLRIWDDRNLLKPLSEVNIEGGGVWRTKWSVDTDGTYILAAAMHAGCSIVRLDSLSQMSKMHTYRDDASQNTLCYGASILNKTSSPCGENYDIHSDNDRKEAATKTNFTIGSCSFYEDIIHIWSCAL